MERNSWVDDPDMIVPYTWNLASRQSPATLPGRQLAGGAWAPLTSEISLKDLSGAREFVAVREWLAWCVCLGVCCFCSLWQRLCQQPRMRVNWAPANIFRRKHRNRSKDWLRELFYALDGDVCSLPRITYAVAMPMFHREWCSFFWLAYSNGASLYCFHIMFQFSRCAAVCVGVGGSLQILIQLWVPQHRELGREYPQIWAEKGLNLRKLSWSSGLWRYLCQFWLFWALLDPSEHPHLFFFNKPHPCSLLAIHSTLFST